MNYNERYLTWLEGEAFDRETKEELQSIRGNDKEIQIRFFKDLEFGTAGLRGMIGAGTNRMNKYTVARAAQGLANYIISQDAGKNSSVAIAYDSRNMSVEFAEYSALVLNANGIKAYVFESLRPTPELSFAIRYLNCIAGIVITASHNPPEYNGFKCYWEDGAQISSPRDDEIIREVNSIEDVTAIRFADKNQAIKDGLFVYIGKEIDDEYEKAVKECMINPEIPVKMAKDFTIVFTPLHGTGNVPVMKILKDIGFKNVYVVPEQEKPDPMFSTVDYPNPEDPKAFELAIRLGKEKGADIIVATDPDADRVGAVIKDDKGEYLFLNGNMTGALLADYIISCKSENGVLPKNGVLIKSIVSTKMIDAISDYYNIETVTVLTGFKYIGEKIKEYEQTGKHTYIFGMEESYGSLPGAYARDKDAVAATVLLCELAAYLKSKGKSMYQGLLDIYDKYGCFREGVKSVTLQGIEGIEKTRYIMETLRNNPIKEIAGYKTIVFEDYKTQTSQNMLNGTTEPLNLPTSDVLRFELENGNWICVRPSGTEPKIKFYSGAKGASIKETDEVLSKLENGLTEIVDQIL